MPGGIGVIFIKVCVIGWGSPVSSAPSNRSRTVLIFSEPIVVLHFHSQEIQKPRIRSIKTILENGYMFVGMPQSLFYKHNRRKQQDTKDIKKNVANGLGFNSTNLLDSEEGRALAKSKVTFMWREKESYDEAMRIYPFVSNIIVPDMAFELGPYAPIRRFPEKLVDITLFLRDDEESTLSVRTRDSIKSILPQANLTFEIVDWNNRLHIFNSTDFFFTDTAVELVSMGRVMVCDRLHAAILGYLTGIPFVYIDQSTGKITKTLSASLGQVDGCMDSERSKWARAATLEEALAIAASMIHAT